MTHTKTIEVRLKENPPIVDLGQLAYGVPFTLVAPREEKESGILYKVDFAFLSGGSKIQTNGNVIAASLAGGLHALHPEMRVVVRDLVATEQ